MLRHFLPDTPRFAHPKNTEKWSGRSNDRTALNMPPFITPHAGHTQLAGTHEGIHAGIHASTHSRTHARTHTRTHTLRADTIFTPLRISHTSSHTCGSTRSTMSVAPKLMQIPSTGPEQRAMPDFPHLISRPAMVSKPGKGRVAPISGLLTSRYHYRAARRPNGGRGGVADNRATDRANQHADRSHRPHAHEPATTSA